MRVWDNSDGRVVVAVQLVADVLFVIFIVGLVQQLLHLLTEESRVVAPNVYAMNPAVSKVSIGRI